MYQVILAYQSLFAFKIFCDEFFWCLFFWYLYSADQIFFFFLPFKVKTLPAIQETQVQSLGWEDPLVKGMAIHFRILAWRIPWTEEPGAVYSPWDHKESDTTE